MLKRRHDATPETPLPEPNPLLKKPATTSNTKHREAFVDTYDVHPFQSSQLYFVLLCAPGWYSRQWRSPTSASWPRFGCPWGCVKSSRMILSRFQPSSCLHHTPAATSPYGIGPLDPASSFPILIFCCREWFRRWSWNPSPRGEYKLRGQSSFLSHNSIFGQPGIVAFLVCSRVHSFPEHLLFVASSSFDRGI
jgi:hypothetical protein